MCRAVLKLSSDQALEREAMSLYSCKDEIFEATYSPAALAAGQATAAPAQPAAQQGGAYADAHGAIMGAAYDFRDAHISGSPNQKRSAHAALESAVTHALRASHGQAYPTIGDLCARIKAADDAAADRDYMLDSNDCIAVLRGEWKGPLTMDKPERASHGQAQADSVLEDAARYRWLREQSSTLFVNISINGEGAEIAETLDSAVDAARKQGENHD